MNKISERRGLDLWKECLDERAEELWHEFEEYSPPAVRLPEISRSTKSLWKLATAVALSVCMLLIVDSNIQRDKADSLERRLAIMELTSNNLPSQLRSASLLREQKNQLSTDEIAFLMGLLEQIDDPNVQLEVLEILVLADAIKTESDLPIHAGGSHGREKLLRASYQHMTSKEKDNEHF